MRALSAFAAFAVGLSAAASASAAPAPAYAVVDRIKGPDGGWDYASFDPVRRRLYVARSTGAMAVDVDTGKVTPGVSKTQRGHSALPVPGTPLVLSTDGGANTAILFDGETGAVAATIPVGTKPDAAAFDPATGTLWVMNADSGDASVIDPAAKAVVATVPIGGALEFAVADGQGRLYVNVEDKNQLAVIDTRARKVLARHPLNGCDGPTGLAYVAESKALVSACANGVAKVTGLDGADLGTLAIGPRPDAAIHDAERRLTFIPSGGDGTLAVIGEGADGKLAVLSRAATAKGARTGALDPKTGRLYLPTASYGPPATPGGKPQATPGSFVVLVVAPQG